MGSWPSKLNSVTGKRPLRDNLFGLLFWTNWDGIYNWNNYADIYCTHTFIFIGCGFSDPDIQLVLENYSFVFPGSPCHYFITSKDGINTEYKRIVKENRNLEIITYDSKDNHRELHDALEELVPMVEDERTRIAKEMDW